MGLERVSNLFIKIEIAKIKKQNKKGKRQHCN